MSFDHMWIVTACALLLFIVIRYY